MGMGEGAGGVGSILGLRVYLTEKRKRDIRYGCREGTARADEEEGSENPGSESYHSSRVQIGAGRGLDREENEPLAI